MKYTPASLAEYLARLTKDAWTVQPLPEPIHGCAEAAHCKGGASELFVCVVEAPLFGASVYMHAIIGGVRHTVMMELRSHNIDETVYRCAHLVRTLNTNT